MSAIKGPGATTLGHICLNPNKTYPDRLDFHFNPSKLTLQKGGGPGGAQGGAGQGPFSARPTAGNAVPGHGSQSSAGGGGGAHTANSGSTPPPTPATVTLQINDLYFDGGFTKSVMPECLKLWNWMSPQSNGPKNQPTPPPPLVDLYLGTTKWITGTIQGLTIEYQIFTPDGKPTRAKITTMTISGANASVLPQNPTSGGLASYSSVVLGAGDTLQSLAYEHYGQPRLWRQLALVNGFDDPLRVRAGTEVMLPTLNEIVKIA